MKASNGRLATEFSARIRVWRVFSNPLQLSPLMSVISLPGKATYANQLRRNVHLGNIVGTLRFCETLENIRREARIIVSKMP